MTNQECKERIIRNVERMRSNRHLMRLYIMTESVLRDLHNTQVAPAQAEGSERK